MIYPTISRVVEVSPTPAELALIFANWMDDEQADFFTEVAKASSAWPNGGWCVQACAIVGKLTAPGREVITKLADHILHLNT